MKNTLLLIIFMFVGINAYSECTNGVLFPKDDINPRAGVMLEISDAWTGEYSNVKVLAGTNYIFSSSVSSDFITISNSAGTEVLKSGTRKLKFSPGFNGIVRLYRHSNSQCGSNNINRIIKISEAEPIHNNRMKFYFGENDEYESRGLELNKNAMVPIRVIGFQKLRSFQLTIRLSSCSHMKSFGPNIIGLENINPAVEINEYTIDPAGNFVTIAWNSGTDLTLDNGEKLFDIVVAGPGAGPPGHCCEQLHFSDNPTITKAFDLPGTEYEIFKDDIHGICEAQFRIGGYIYRENGDPVSDVSVKLLDGAFEVDEVLTTKEGWYEFTNLVEGNNYTILPTKIDHIRKGLDANDVSVVAQYAEGAIQFSSAYKIIAADFHEDHQSLISMDDAIQISSVASRRSLVDVASEFAWKFVDADFTFDEILQKESYGGNFPVWRKVQNISGDNCEVNFIGIKMGDLNLNSNLEVNYSNLDNAKSDINQVLTTGSEVIVKDSIFILKIKAQNFNGIKDFQFGFTWDTAKMEYIGLNSNEISESASSFNGLIIGSDSISKSEGSLYVGWYDPNFAPDGITLFSDEVIAEFAFKLKDLSMGIINFEQDTSIHSFYTNMQDRPVNIKLDFKKITVDIISSNLNTNIERNYKVFPTICSGLIHIQPSGDKEFLLEMYDMNGRQIQRELYTGDANLHVENLINGQYLLKITEVQTGDTGTFRIVKK